MSCYLANDPVKAKSENQPDKLVINYRFKRSRPVCEPVQLLAKVIFLFKNSVTEMFLVCLLLHRNNQRCEQVRLFTRTTTTSTTTAVYPRHGVNCVLYEHLDLKVYHICSLIEAEIIATTTRSPSKKNHQSFSEEEVNRHLMELNGLNKGRKTTLSGQNRRLERGHSSQIQITNLNVPYQPILNNTPARINEESNSSISQILSSVLNDSHCPTQVILIFFPLF